MSSASRTTVALLLASSALFTAAAAFAQDATTDRVVVRGTYIPDEKRLTSEINSVLDAQDYAVQGDGDIAAALARITGITIADDKFVYVRGLNERYSNISLNGSPLPSPEPLRKIAPLDMFPTGLLSTTVVQKTFSPQYSGEFGGGLIAMRSATLPAEDFFKVGVSTGFTLDTTAQRGLTYYGGGDEDYTGFDDGTRNLPDPLAAIFDTTRVGTSLPIAQQEEIGRSLVNSPLWVLQNIQNVEPNFGVNAAGGKVLTVGANAQLGVLASAGYSNDWTTKVGETGQGALGAGAFGPLFTADRMSTDQNIKLNGLLSLGLELWDDHEIRLTALGTRSTLKKASTSVLTYGGTAEGGIVDNDRSDKLGWFERQLWMTQLSGEHHFEQIGGLEIDWRTSYAEAMRDAPYERTVSYRCMPTTAPGAPVGVRQPDCDRSPSSTIATPGFFAYGGRQSDNLTQFSKVSDISRDYGIDLTYPVMLGSHDIEFKAGYAWTNQHRTAFSRQFRFTPGGVGIPSGLQFSRIDYIFADPNIIDSRLRLVETGGLIFPEAYRADLTVDAFYGQFDAQVTDYIRLALGGRIEEGEQYTDTFNKTLPDNGAIESVLNEDFFLPAGTLTWNFADDLQMRLGASKTITRPQFRELAVAEFFDPESEQSYRGNPFLLNTEVTNYDARLEYYFARDQFVTVGAFYKDMTNPIEEYVLPVGDTLSSSFLNAPSATLWGVEGEFEKVLPLQDWLSLNWAWLNDKDVVFKTNYTYTNSEVSADGTVTLASLSAFPTVNADVRPAAGFIRDGRQLQGASEHIFNVQFGWRSENSDFNILLNYASDRIRSVEDLSKGLPAVIESPPITLDLVYLRRFMLAGGEYEFNMRLSNLLGSDYEAFQEALGVRVPVDTYNQYQSLTIGLKRSF